MANVHCACQKRRKRRRKRRQKEEEAKDEKDDGASLELQYFLKS